MSLDGSTLFIICILVTSLLVIAFGVKNPKEYFSTRDGKGVLKGIVLFLLVGVILSLPKCASADWFNYGEVFLGLDYTKNQSPQCHLGKNNEHLTSNGGLKLNIFSSDDEEFEANLKYTHHSCAINVDDKSYDAIGIEFSHRLF